MFDLGALGASALNYFGAREANRANRQMAREQMHFQERMSNTAYQRMTQDMREAGLNPILGLNSGGASAPPGATATMQNELQGALNSAVEVRRANAELENLKAQNKFIEAQISQVNSQAALNKELAKVAEAEQALKNFSAKSVEATLPGLQVEADIDRGYIGPAVRYINRVAKIFDHFNPLSKYLPFGKGK